MAIAKTGAIVGSLSGNLSGANFANSRFGLTVRKRRPPPGPSTETQLVIQAAHRLSRSRWPALTEMQRDAWRSFASNRTYRNRLGSHRNLTAQQLWLKYDFQSAVLGLPSRPLPPPPWPFEWPTGFVLTATAGVSIIVAPTPAFVPGGRTFIVAGSRPVTTHPINHFARWAVIGVITTVLGGWLDCLAPFEGRFGTIQATERIGIRIRYVDPVDIRFGWIAHAATVA